jgi:glyoxylase-like metal-dependent hydrolase (beta-lactamase superfamily II)
MIKKQLILAVIFIALIFPGFLFTGESKEVIKISKLTGNIYKIDHNPTHNFVHLASRGKDGILLVDTAFRDTGKELLTRLKKLGNENIRYIVNTHMHADHIGANELFAAEAPVIAHSKARKRFLQRYSSLPPVNPEGVPVITFEDNLTLYFNGEKIILKHVKSDTFKKYKNWERKKDWVEVINTKLFGET